MTLSRHTAGCLSVAVSALVAFALGAGGGCSKKQEATIDASAVLVKYEQDRRRHDPLHFGEVDLGEFTVTQRRDFSIYYIRFHLFAVVPDRQLERFNKLLATHGERVRATVREAAQGCELEQLNEPSLGWLKSEMISSINDVLKAPIVRDVAFSTFSFERG